MCKLGFDLGHKDLFDDDLKYVQGAVANWKRNKDVILDGDQYPLVRPYCTENAHMALNCVSKHKKLAILFAYDIIPRFKSKCFQCHLQGLNLSKKYKITEINLMPNTKSDLRGNEEVFSGDFLMKVGIEPFTFKHMTNRVIETTAV